MTPTIVHLKRYPVKGLGPENLDAVDLIPGLGFPWDRVYALALEETRFDPDNPVWQPKTNFFMLVRNACLAELATEFNAETRSLSVARDGEVLVAGCLDTMDGRREIEAFFAVYLAGEKGGRPHLVAAHGGHMFSDHRNRVVSLINLASARDLERVVGAPVDPVRFRGNFYFDSDMPWEELSWVGRELTVGRVRLEVTKRTERCAATNVDPVNGARNMNLPKVLNTAFGHMNFGVYAKVLEEGRVNVGDPLRI